jgi:hypothetical protein
MVLFRGMGDCRESKRGAQVRCRNDMSGSLLVYVRSGLTISNGKEA